MQVVEFMQASHPVEHLEQFSPSVSAKYPVSQVETKEIN
jgi:hypothetical protein